LGDDTWNAVEVTPDGWRIVEHVPVRFIRPPGLRPLPRPVRHENGVSALHSILPDDTDARDAKILLLSFLVGVFMPVGSLPLLALAGRQGSGKSTKTRQMRQLTDPNQAPARQQPRNEDDLIIAARNGALVASDNLSRISPELSDALCRLATGAGFSKRRLYSDSDEIIVQVRRPVIINGITDLVRMPDLADRALFVELPARRSFTPETVLEAAFNRDHPAMLGALYSAVSAALAGHTNEVSSPGLRLSDFEHWARAAAPAFGIGPDEVSAALINNRALGDRMLIDDDAVASLILKLLDEQPYFAGTATDLLSQLRELADSGDLRSLPASPRGLSMHLRRFVPAFERIGISL
jgi:energy-coupling factor transporter ATP-binding protein EcfA2